MAAEVAAEVAADRTLGSMPNDTEVALAEAASRFCVFFFWGRGVGFSVLFFLFHFIFFLVPVFRFWFLTGRFFFFF